MHHASGSATDEAQRMLGHVHRVSVVHKSGMRFLHVEGSGRVSTMRVCGPTDAVTHEAALAANAAFTMLETAVREGRTATVLCGGGSAEAMMAMAIRKRSKEMEERQMRSTSNKGGISIPTSTTSNFVLSGHEMTVLLRGRNAFASALDTIASALRAATTRIAHEDDDGGGASATRCTNILDLRSTKMSALRAAVYAAVNSARIGAVLNEY